MLRRGRRPPCTALFSAYKWRPIPGINSSALRRSAVRRADVRVDEQDLLRRHRERASWEILDVAGTEREARQVHASRVAADGEQADPDRMMDGAAKQECFVLEVQERHELGVADEIAEER